MGELLDLLAATEPITARSPSPDLLESSRRRQCSLAIIFDAPYLSFSNPKGPAMPQQPALIVSTFAPARSTSVYWLPGLLRASLVVAMPVHQGIRSPSGRPAPSPERLRREPICQQPYFLPAHALRSLIPGKEFQKFVFGALLQLGSRR